MGTMPVDGRDLALNLHPDVVVLMGALAVGYWWLTTRVGPDMVEPGAEVVSRRNLWWWYGGIGLLVVFSEWPVHDLAEHYSYAVHMTEHLVFTVACAPMLLLGMPGWMLRWLVAGRRWCGVVRFVCRPVPAIALNSAVLLVTHWPAVTNLTTHNEAFHFGVHVVLFGSALALWMPLINRIPELPRLSKPLQILYLFGQSFTPIVPTLFLIFSNGVLYKAYTFGPRYLGWSPNVDQEVAGSLMGALQPVILWGIAAVYFFSWWAEEQRRERRTLPGDLTWDDVSREFAHTADRG
ncbi:MAG: hypothetical protein NVSMB16_03040 [Acidimicrobiales bacterium]